LATLVSPNPNLAGTAQELIWLTQARWHGLGSTTTLKPTPPQIWNLTAAIATAALIKPESRFYESAQKSLKSWQAQLQDLTLLQAAWVVGEIPTLPTKQLALIQAQQIGPDRPRRKQAQTLISYWTVEAQRLEDRPVLVQAQKVAEKGTIQALKAAIAQVRQIGPKRPLRPEAQTLISTWTARIQTIEDQPILDRAWAMANQGNLTGAIQIATLIPPGRALYWQAQSVIGNWQAQIRAAEIARQRAAEEALRRKLELQAPQPAPTPSDETIPLDSANPALPFPSPVYPESSPAPEFSPSPSPYPSTQGYPSPASPTPIPSTPSVIVNPTYEPIPAPPPAAPPVYNPYEAAPPPSR
jgi:hypothetical protein